MEDLNDTNELERGAPVLFGIPKSDPFVVPENFFEHFPHEVQTMIVTREQAAPVWNWWKRLAIALPIVALIAGGLWWMQRGTLVDPPMAQLIITPLSNAELGHLNDNELAAATEEVAPKAASADLGHVDLLLSDEELTAYLDNEHEELTDLITQ